MQIATMSHYGQGHEGVTMNRLIRTSLDKMVGVNVMKRAPLIGICTVLVVAGVLSIPMEVHPSPNTRLILEHTHKTYISPPCYEQATKTNNLAEADMEKAQELKYQPESSCTANSLAPIKQPIASVLAQAIGLKKSQWEW